MKTYRKALLLLLVVGIACLLLCACSRGNKESEGLAFELNEDGTASVAGIGECTDEDIVIPQETPDGVAVTSISANAFENNKTITSVTIPEGVTRIGHDAFRGSTIGEIDFPDTVVEIGPSAFQDCHGLIEVELPANLKVISARTFSGCLFINSVKLPQALEEIELMAFSGCSMDEIDIPESVESIARDAFFGNSLNYINGMDSLEWCEANGFELSNIHMECVTDEVETIDQFTE